MLWNRIFRSPDTGDGAGAGAGGAPPAPAAAPPSAAPAAAPAVIPAPPPPPAAPVRTDPRSRTSEIARTLRENLNANDGVLVADVPDDKGVHHSVFQPRGEKGKFAGDGKPPAGEVAANGAGADGSGAADDATGSPNVDGAAPATEGGGNQGGDGQDGAAGDGVSDGQADGADALIFEAPGRGKDDAPIAIKLETPEQAEALRRLKNGYMRGQHFHREREQVMAQKAELDFVGVQIGKNPVGFIVQNVEPERVQEVAEHLLMMPGVLEALEGKIEGWRNDPQMRRADLAEARDKWRTDSDSAKEEFESSRFSERLVTMATDVAAEMTALVEQAFPADQAKARRFYMDALRDSEEYLRANPEKARQLRPETLRVNLHERLRLYGVNPQAKPLPSKVPVVPGAPPARATPTPESARALEEARNKARGNTGKALATASAGRKVLGNQPGAGSGSVPNVPVLPPKTNLKGAFAAARQFIGKAVAGR